MRATKVPQSPLFTQDDIPVLDAPRSFGLDRRRERAVGSVKSKSDFSIGSLARAGFFGSRNASRAVGKASRGAPDGPMLHERRPNRSMSR